MAMAKLRFPIMVLRSKATYSIAVKKRNFVKMMRKCQRKKVDLLSMNNAKKNVMNDNPMTNLHSKKEMKSKAKGVAIPATKIMLLEAMKLAYRP